MGTAIFDLNLVQEQVSVDQDPLLLVFLDLRKVYDTIYHGLLMTTLEGCGAGPHMCRLLSVFWDQQEVVIHQSGYPGPHFKKTRGTNQGGLISPTIFNLIVDNVLQNWLARLVEDQLVSQEGLGLAVWRCLGLFYAKKIIVGLRYPGWLHVSLNVIIGLF